MARSLVRPLDVLVEREDSDASDHAVLTSKTRSSLETDGEGLDRRCIRLARRTRSHGARVNTATDKHPDRDVTAEPPSYQCLELMPQALDPFDLADRAIGGGGQGPGPSTQGAGAGHPRR